MKNQKLADWLILNRDSEGLAELFYELGLRIIEREAVIINSVRDEKCGKLACGKRDELISLETFLLEPLNRTETSRDT
jgi:hypothetical protein